MISCRHAARLLGAALGAAAAVGSNATTCSLGAWSPPAPPSPPHPSAPRLRRLFSRRGALPPQPQTAAAAAASPLHHMVLVLPGVLHADECRILRCAVDALLSTGDYDRDQYDGGGGDEDDDGDYALRRVSIVDLPTEARDLSDSIIRLRVLPALEQYVPELLQLLNIAEWETQAFEWASDEPSINVYTKGGKFDPHEDGYALTVLVNLSENSLFDGGGTRFYENEQADSKSQQALVRPPVGTAICFDGDITHAGVSVSRGVRHVFVASFSIAKQQSKST